MLRKYSFKRKKRETKKDRCTDILQKAAKATKPASISQSTPHGTLLLHYHPFIMMQALVFQFSIWMSVKIICALLAAICLFSHTKYTSVVAPNVIKWMSLWLNNSCTITWLYLRMTDNRHCYQSSIPAEFLCCPACMAAHTAVSFHLTFILFLKILPLCTRKSEINPHSVLQQITKDILTDKM